MVKKGKKGQSEAERDLEQLRKEIAQKGKEIELLRKTMEEMRTQIQGKEETGETAGLGKMFEDVSELLDAGFSIFGASSDVQGRKSRGKGLLGLINDLAALAEKSETYEKRVDLGKRGVIDVRVSSRPIRGSYARKPIDRLRISKPKKEILPARTPVPPTAGPVKEREPIVDVFEEKDHVRVVAELPDVKEGGMGLHVENNTLMISADTSAGKYYKEVELPAPVEEDTIESVYRNGILEVKLSKAKGAGKTEESA